jgi:hypothetical protein
MGSQTSKIRETQYTDSADMALDVLERLIQTAEKIQLMTIKEMLRVRTTVNTYMGSDFTLTRIVAKQEVVAQKIEHKVQEAQRTYFEKIRKHASVLAHFNDRDGDDIIMTMINGISTLKINEKDTIVRIITAIPPLLEFEYTTGSNTWKWNVDFVTRNCVGTSPRTLYTKTLKTVLEDDSQLSIPEF